MPTPPMSDVTTRDIRVGAAAFYLPDESKPDANEWVFGYNIVIANNSDVRVQLLRRHWQIIDGDGQEHIVDGDGVIGQQPLLEPEQAFKYASFCPLPTEWGTMEGHYIFQTDDAETFEVQIARFWLTTQQTLSPQE